MCTSETWVCINMCASETALLKPIWDCPHIWDVWHVCTCTCAQLTSATPVHATVFNNFISEGSLKRAVRLPVRVCVWHDSFIHWTWLVYARDTTHSYGGSACESVWRGHSAWSTCRCAFVYDMTHSYVWQDSFIHTIVMIHSHWLIVCAMNHDNHMYEWIMSCRLWMCIWSYVWMNHVTYIVYDCHDSFTLIDCVCHESWQSYVHT